MAKNNPSPQSQPLSLRPVPPDTCLKPYPQSARKAVSKASNQGKNPQQAFEIYIKNGINWAKQEWGRGGSTARMPSEGLCVNDIRLEVERFRENGWQGVTATTEHLLRWWFETPRRLPFWFSQREAVETIIYLYEVAGVLNPQDLINRFGAYPVNLPPSYGHYPRYALGMATASGKTLVMAMLTVWSYFNYLYEDRKKYSRFFLFVAPNLVVYDRLLRDLQGLRIFREFDLIPPAWEKDLALRIITRDTFSPADLGSLSPDEGTILVTNIHQLEIGNKGRGRRESSSPLLEGLGFPNPGKDPYKAEAIRFRDIAVNFPNLMVFKDEAHHIHRVESAWQKYIWQLHEDLKQRFGRGLFMELDFSATPRDQKGNLLPWVVVDFSLREALQTQIVKEPLKVQLQNPKGKLRKEDLLKTALERWREHNRHLEPLGKKAVLFVICKDIKEAFQVYQRLLQESDVDEGNLLLIHSELEKWKGHQVSVGSGKKVGVFFRLNGKRVPLDGELARKLVRELDDEENPVKVVVSVMMLNEGWDVRSVTVVLGLRAFSAPSGVLPAQVIGRGLRKLFPEQGINRARWINVLEVVGPPQLITALERALLATEHIVLQPYLGTRQALSFKTRSEISPAEDIVFPRPENLSVFLALDVAGLIDSLFHHFAQSGSLKRKYDDLQRFNPQHALRYRVSSVLGEVITGGQVIISGHEPWEIVLFEEVDKLMKILALPFGFDKVVEKTMELIEKEVFLNHKGDKTTVRLNDKVIAFLYITDWFGMLRNEAVNFLKALGLKNYLREEVDIEEFRAVSETKPFPWHRDFVDADKSLLARIVWDEEKTLPQEIPSSPVDNQSEATFALFLDRAKDVVSFVKNVRHYVDLCIPYYDSRTRKVRRFFPDFIVRTKGEGENPCRYWLVEIKGRPGAEDRDKNRAAEAWCEAISKKLGSEWCYAYVPDRYLKKLGNFDTLEDFLQSVREEKPEVFEESEASEAREAPPEEGERLLISFENFEKESAEEVPSKAQEEANLSPLLKAVRELLLEAGRPLSVREIRELAEERGVKLTEAAFPEDAIRGALENHLRKFGPEKPFVKVKMPGKGRGTVKYDLAR